MFKVPLTYKGIILSIINGLDFSISFKTVYKYLFINFSGFQQEVFPIFKPLNTTEAAYDN